jgi:cytochrome c oxidase subunit 2
MKSAKCSIILTFLLALCLLGVTTHLSAAEEGEQVIKITAKRFEYSPKDITVKMGVPVVLEFTSLDVLHGFSCPTFKIRTDIAPGKENTLRFTPDKAGTFAFHCDNFCGLGHGEMTGTITVTP